MLNAVELTVDRVEGPDAIMRVGEGERVVVPSAETGVAAGAAVLVAVRPERIAITDAGPAPEGDASRVGGTVAQVVYLGTLTQFHVDTTLGTRLIAHRLSDDPRGADRRGRPRHPQLGPRGRLAAADVLAGERRRAPRFTSWSAMIARWISLVPSQIRSTRTSR